MIVRKDHDITLIPITDVNILIGALKEDDIYKQVLHIDTLDGWIPDIVLCEWLLGYVDNNFVGLLMIRHETDSLCSFHGGVYKKYRNKSLDYVRESMDIIKGIYKCKLITTVPNNYKHVIKFVEKLGLKEIGRISNAYEGVNDMIIFEEVE